MKLSNQTSKYYIKNLRFKRLNKQKWELIKRLIKKVIF